MADPEVTKRIAASRAELDAAESQLVKQAAEVRVERGELAVDAAFEALHLDGDSRQAGHN